MDIIYFNQYNLKNILDNEERHHLSTAILIDKSYPHQKSH